MGHNHQAGPTTGNSCPVASISVISTDVVIVGAGPAGTAAAIILARAGRSVTVVDKAVFPRDKCCGDGLTSLALRELEALNFQPSTVPNWQTVRAAWLRSPSGREVCLPLPSDGIFAATTPRRELDAALVDLAVDAGATVLQGHAVTNVEQHPDHVVVTANGLDSIRCRYVIAADGMWSPIRRQLGAGEPGYLGEWHAVRQYGCQVTGPAAERLYVWFEQDILPGYVWSFPLPDGRVNVGFGVPRSDQRSGKDLKALWPALLKRDHIASALGPTFELEDRYSAWPIPARIDRAVLTTDRVLFVGDAAMATDTMTGEGIGQALLTGRLAAQALVSAGATQPEQAAAHYTRSVQHHLVADHRMSALLGRILQHERGARGAIKLIGTNDWTRRNFARWMFEDEPRAVALTPSRWHRQFMRQPGSFR